MTVERGSGIALWRQIEQALAADIAGKVISDRLPNEIELAARFGVNRHTIRRAVQALETRGLVRIEQGRGTFVQEGLIDYRLGRRSRFSHSLDDQQRRGISQIQRSTTTVPRNEVCELLDIPPGTSVLQVDALDVVDDRVIGVCTQYFPLPRFAGFETRYAATGRIADALPAYGITEFNRRLSRVTARLPRPETAQLLAQPKTQPILYVENVYVDSAGVPIEYGITRFAADAVQLLIEPEAG
ncbi:phosphonate metabolism transcriptional regulator PhnF [Jeongeupia chitinilytica]|uniref:Phosphonate metabolism transcriptional regulator PhnF n=1 Tax=Jeongeupia chitinilytica TaxID=1041641 RepID=A0ABQ3H411_9NEIS|nr:phosphonate metabolism transcriptional regulator PhnF [Jeongeupia chitinilytica]GHD63632.1 phosphonate metabolism transcriptional regulator PhnF [Jeongeupia chitinilytica]